MVRHIILLISFVTVGSCKFVDLTYSISRDMVLWPGRQVTFKTEAEGELPDGGWVASRAVCMSEHTGTHMDAPYHFYKDGWKLNQIPFDYFLDKPAVCVDVYPKVHRYDSRGQLSVISNYHVTREDLIQWEGVNGQLPPGSIVFIRTGWGARWPNADEYRGIPEEFRTTTAPSTKSSDAFAPVDPNAPANMNYPGLHPSAATFLSVERNVIGVGIDTMGVDVGNDTSYPVHKILTKRGVFMLENVANMHLLPARGFRAWAIPLKLDGGTGAPTRVFVQIPDGPQQGPGPYPFPPPPPRVRRSVAMGVSAKN